MDRLYIFAPAIAAREQSPWWQDWQAFKGALYDGSN
jgi:hypothetical protein